MEVFVKAKALYPKIISKSNIEILCFDEDDLFWEQRKIRAHKNLLDRMLALANNVVITNLKENAYIFAEVEAPGLKAIVGEGVVDGIKTTISPIPAKLFSIRFLKVGNEIKEVLKLRVEPDTVIYEGYIDTANVEYDLIVLETDRGIRVLLPDDLYIPQRRTRKTTTSEKSKKKNKKRRKRKIKRAKRRK